MHNNKSKVQEEKSKKSERKKIRPWRLKDKLRFECDTDTADEPYVQPTKLCHLICNKVKHPILYTVINAISPKTLYAHCAQTHKQIIEWQQHTYRYAVESSPRPVHMHSVIEGAR